MNTFTCSAQVDSKGRITVPARIRDRLGLESGDEVQFSIVNCEVKRKQVSSFEEAKAFIDKFSDVESFSFDGEVIEAVFCE